MRVVFGLLIIVCAVLDTYGQKADSLLRLSEDSTTTTSKKERNWAVYPAADVSPEIGVGVGAITFFVFEDKIDDGIDRVSAITPFFLYTSNRQMMTLADVDYYFKNGNNVNGTIRYFNFPDKYFGIGSGTDPDLVDGYTDRYFRLDGRITRPQNDHLFLGIYYDLQYNNIIKYDKDSLLAADSPNGIKGGRNMGLGPGLQYDTRNNTLYPTDGCLINLGITVFSEAIGGEYNYQQYVIDFRQYFEFLSSKNVLAYQFQSNMMSGTDIPFYKLNRIAGDERLRGIGHKNLYRDRQSVYFQVEGRQELFWRFGGVVFAGVGQVFDKFKDLNVNNTRMVYGLGGRFQAIKGKKMNVRLDLGFSDQGEHALYLSVREAF